MAANVSDLMTVTVTEAVDELFDIILPLGHSQMVLGRPGAGKSAVQAARAKDFIRRFGGVFIGWEAGDYEIVTDPPEKIPEGMLMALKHDMGWDDRAEDYGTETKPQIGGKWAWGGDIAAPKIVPNEDGIYALPALVYRHCVMTGVTSLDLQGSNMPIDTLLTEHDMTELGIRPEPISVFAKPFLFQGMPNRSVFCILCLDEFAKTKENFPKYASLCYGGRVGDHELPGMRSSVVLIGNRPEDRAGSADPTMDLIDRVHVTRVQPDQAGHVKWMRERGFPAWAMAFCHENVAADAVYRAPVPKDGQSYCSSRSFAMLVAELMQRERITGKPIDPDDRMVQIACTTKIGSSAGPRLLDMLRLGPQLPTVREIIESPDNAKMPTAPIGAIYLMEILARAATVKNFDYMCKYIRRFKGAPRALFVESLMERHKANVKNVETGLPEGDPEAARLWTSDMPSWETIYDAAQKMREMNR
jgi:hypothetical protein